MLEGLFGKKKNNEGNSNIKVLTVEDNEIDRKVITSILDKSNYSILTAENGEEGLKVAKESKPDLILLDCEMPIMDGVTMCGKLKEDDEISDIPVIFITSVDTPRNIIDCFENDAEFFLSKPINAKVLKSQIEQVLEEVKSKS